MAPFEPSRMALPSVFNHKTCNYLLYNWPAWLSWAQFCLGKWAQERWHSGSRKEQRVVEGGGEREGGSIHGELPGLSLPDMTPPPRVHRKLSEMFRKTRPKSKRDDMITAHISFMKEPTDR